MILYTGRTCVRPVGGARVRKTLTDKFRLTANQCNGNRHGTVGVGKITGIILYGINSRRPMFRTLSDYEPNELDVIVFIIIIFRRGSRSIWSITVRRRIPRE